ncbi:hypothetical protein DYBT9275_01154 [Dyadobacter sp. CECT 9275]|uniref:Phage shock protein C (PspC) family protein n=1 Tax=Dyadobacter helix TaxID=2822344 RepID=A0A916J9B1_9BACT|nr:PspC domain-containing protein [Dyadobacter sp. CECT 9275]CAG4993348.1 hypothetical protein DYBT9275_01154 [Dyadobacter sp. CECT 9275]
MEKKLHRIPDQAVFGGVASGIAQYMQIDVVIVRVILVVMLLLPIPPNFGWTGLIYIVLWAVLPTGPAEISPVANDTAKPFDPLADKKRSDQTIMVLGGALIFFGAVMLLDDFSIWYKMKHYFWPVLLIAIGAFLILRQRDKEHENNNGVNNPTPPPADPAPPVEPDPQPYTPFTSENSSPTVWPEDPENKRPGDNDDDIIKVN